MRLVEKPGCLFARPGVERHETIVETVRYQLGYLRDIQIGGAQPVWVNIPRQMAGVERDPNGGPKPC